MKNFHSFRAPVRSISAAALAIAVAATPVLADGQKEERSLPAFTDIVVMGAVDLELKAGQDQHVTVKTEKTKLENVITEVKSGTLYIDLEKENSFWDSGEADIIVHVPSLDSLDVRGAVDGKLSGLKADTFKLTIKGAGDVELKGTCVTFDLDIRGAGDVDAEDFKWETVEVRLRGAGDTKVYASKSVDAHVMGVGAVDVYGNPSDVTKKVSGIGDITVKDK